MSSEGIIVGCDQKQEWLLPWWWKHYSSHNTYPVAFADFGMSPNALTWCEARGTCIKVSPILVDECNIPASKKESWEDRFGNGIWFCRSTWFNKPLALQNSPFQVGLWLDLDCQVNGSLEPLFNSLVFGAEIALVKEPEFIQRIDQTEGVLLPGEVSYNSGVIVFRKNAKILELWAEEAFKNNAEHIGDQQALSRAIFLHRPSIADLSSYYNWVRGLGPNSRALIYHFTGGNGKMEILKVVDPSLIPLIESLEKETSLIPLIESLQKEILTG